MNKYRILLHGQNFLFENEGKLVKTGFFTTRFIEAKNPQEAEEKAIKIAWRELDTTPEGSDDPAIIKADEIKEIASFGNNKVPGKGFTFYMADKRIARKKPKTNAVDFKSANNKPKRRRRKK